MKIIIAILELLGLAFLEVTIDAANRALSEVLFTIAKFEGRA